MKLVAEFYRDLHAALAESKAKAFVRAGEVRGYSELYDAMLGIHFALRGQRQIKVAVYGGKSFEAYAAIYAIILSGNVWVPVSPDLPPARVVEMLESCDARMLLSDTSEVPAEIVAWCDERGARLTLLSEIANGVEKEPFAALPENPDETAYVMFTSGSTGRPKGVPMTHANYVPFIRNALGILPFRQGEVFADYHDFGFDLSIFYLFCAPLTRSAFAPFGDDKDRLFPLKHIVQNGVTVLATVPSLIRRILTANKTVAPATQLRVLFSCGEPFRLDLLDYAFRVLKVPHVYNFYGLTETGVENFYHECRPTDPETYRDEGFVPIGLPLPGNAVRLESDELWIAGDQVTPGYLGGVGAERFVWQDGVRWYKSGDVVLKRHGVYFCKGRLDSQVKVNGYRVELMDVESHLRRLPGVEEAVCFVVQNGQSEYLVAAVQSPIEIDAAAVRAGLAGKLPAYMIPKAFYRLSEMPQNNSGKIDRPRLRELCLEAHA